MDCGLGGENTILPDVEVTERSFTVMDQEEAIDKDKSRSMDVVALDIKQLNPILTLKGMAGYCYY